jgi:copper(I)-binding protein
MRTTGFLACTMLLLGTCAVAAEKTSVQVSNAWVRATVPGQPVAGAYMDLRADRAVKLVGVASPVAKRGEIHEMKDDGGMMTMRAVEAVALPAGTTAARRRAQGEADARVSWGFRPRFQADDGGACSRRRLANWVLKPG